MSDDGDFGGYVAARWPQLVRSLVLLGCPEGLAADVALDALARCQRDWSRTTRTDDIDGVVRAELLAAWDRRRGGAERWWDTSGDPSAHSSTDERAAPGVADLVDLDALAPNRRAKIVLDRFLGAATLAGPAVAAPHDSTGEATGGPGPERLRSAAAQVLVLAPPTVEEVTGRRRDDTRRRTRRSIRLTLAAVAPLLLIAGGVTWAVDRDPAGADAGAVSDKLAPLTAVRAENPTNVVWEAGGVLHLPHDRVTVPPMRQLAPFGTGALYADREARVVLIDDDGTRTVIGHEDPDTGFVSSDGQGWAAWVDPTGAQRQLMVVDVVARRVVGRLPVDDDTRPIAIDGDTVYLANDVGARGWQPRSSPRPADAVEPADLVDVAAKSRVYQTAASELRLSLPLADVSIPLLGIGARLGDSGELLSTRTSGQSGGDGPVAIYETATGDALQTGVRDDEVALDVTLGPDQTVTYLIARKVDRPQGSDELRASFAGALQLRTCRLYLADVAPKCRLVTDIPVSGPVPMLAH